MTVRIGNIPLNIRVRIEAGLGGKLTDIGYADTIMHLPDASGLERRLTEAVTAFTASIEAGRLTY